MEIINIYFLKFLFTITEWLKYLTEDLLFMEHGSSNLSSSEKSISKHLALVPIHGYSIHLHMGYSSIDKNIRRSSYESKLSLINFSLYLTHSYMNASSSDTSVKS